MGFNQEYVKTSSLDICLNDRLFSFRRKLNEMDAVEYDKHSLDNYYSFIGNGYIGISQDSNRIVVIKADKGLSIESDFAPLLDWSVSNYFHNERYILDFLSGVFIKFQCHKQSSLCASITSTSYVHRTRPELIIQELRIHNPTRASIQIALKYRESNSNRLKKEKTIKSNNIEYDVLTQKIPILTNSTSKKSDQFYIAAFLKPVLPAYINVIPGQDETFQHISAVKYSEPLQSNKIDYANETSGLINSLLITLKEAQNTHNKVLKKEHENVWQSLWSTGITIDKSLAPDALNGHQINSTIYYLLSNSQTFLNYRNLSITKKRFYEHYLNQASHCYTGHDTLYATHLWTLVSTKSDLDSLIRKWFIMLHKRGCGLLTKAGAHGLIQAVVYSAGSFNFAGDHISFDMHPNDLQRRLHFRNLQYNGLSSPKFDVAVDLDLENRPQLFVSIRDSKGKLYACDAGCVDPPIELSTSMKFLPIKITKPRHPILYISDQISNIEELKHVNHFSVIEDVKAHNHHIIALHKHGHSWGGLPPLFWFTIILLVLVFHLFLCKLIYTEYCRYKEDYDMTLSDPSRTSDNSRIQHHYLPSTRRSQYYRNLH